MQNYLPNYSLVPIDEGKQKLSNKKIVWNIQSELDYIYCS